MNVWNSFKCQKRLHIGLALSVVAGVLFYFLIYDRAPPFAYDDGAHVTCPDDEPRCKVVGRDVVVQEGATIMRHRLVKWYRTDCDIEISGHVRDVQEPPNVLDIDRFPVPGGPVMQARWIAETKAGGSHPFNRVMTATMPVDKHGIKHYGTIYYYSLDSAWCNMIQRMWPFSLWPIMISGPMMGFKVEPGQ